MPIASTITGDIVTITISYPETRNGLNVDNIRELADTISHAAQYKEARFLILKGVPDWFCIGGSGSFMEQLLDNTIEERIALTTDVQSIILAILRSPLLTVALVDGLAAGAGADMVFASDLVLVTERARLSLLYSKLGLVPDTGFSLLEWRLGAQSIVAYAKSGVWRADDLAKMDWIEPVPEHIDSFLRRSFRHSSHAFAASKKLRNGTIFGDIEKSLYRAAEAQAKVLERPDVRERLRHSASTQRAMRTDTS